MDIKIIPVGILICIDLCMKVDISKNCIVVSLLNLNFPAVKYLPIPWLYYIQVFNYSVMLKICIKSGYQGKGHFRVWYFKKNSVF